MAKQTNCRANGCEASIPDTKAFCNAHWRMLPEKLKSDIYRHYAHYKNTGQITREHLAVMAQCVAAIDKAAGVAVPAGRESSKEPVPATKTKPAERPNHNVTIETRQKAEEVLRNAFDIGYERGLTASLNIVQAMKTAQKKGTETYIAIERLETSLQELL